MALLFDARFRALDSSGNAYSGAKLNVYTAGTTTPITLYTTSALSTTQANPVVADSAGRFAQIFTAEGLTLDLLLTTSAGVTITSYEDVQSLGSDTGTLVRDFTTSRARLAGSAGVTSFEAGDAVGDDVGGKWRIGGYDSTQADTGELDAAAITTTGTLTVGGVLDTTGSTSFIKERGKKLPSVIETAPTAFSAASTVDITLTNTPTGVRAWEILVYDLVWSASTTLLARLAYDATPTFKTGASDYRFGRITAATGGASVAVTRDDANDFIEIREAEGTVAASTQPAYIRMTVITPNSGSGETIILGEMMSFVENGGLFYTHPITFSGAGRGGYGRATTIRLYPGTGTISGTYLVKPLRGTGDA
jgi:hypothetical protein